MSTIVSRNVGDLSDSSRQGIEQVLGAPLEANQRVYIIVEAPRAGPAEAVKLQAAQRIRDIFAEAQSHAEAHAVPDAEIDAAIDEAMADVRRRG